jgi:CheY-like chemotaxis protein
LDSGNSIRRLLVVDDDELVRETVRTILEDSGYEVVEAAEGEEAIRALEKRDVDAAVVDIFMPKMDGLELIRELHRRSPSIRILAISGSTQGINTGMLSAARALGANEILNKPFDPSDLIALVRKMLSRER